MACSDQVSTQDLEDAKKYVQDMYTFEYSNDLSFVDFDGVTRTTAKGLESKYIMTAINGGAWAAGQTFTAYNQYMNYSGTPHKPKNTTTLPYVVGSAPDTDFVEPFESGLSNDDIINDVSQGYAFGSISLMLASIIVFPVDKPLQVFDGSTGLYNNYVVTTTITNFPLTTGLYALPLELSFDPSLTTGQAINNNKFNNSSSLGNKLQVFAHRGLGFQFPENTLVACSSSINLGVDGLELDAAVSSDGVTYLFHDTTVDSLTDGTGTFTSLASSYIDNLKFTSLTGTILEDEKIPRLYDVLKLARRHGIYIMLELKLVTSQSDIDLIIADVVSTGMEHLVSLQSGNLANAQYVRSQNPTINVGYITSDPSYVTYVDNLAMLGNATVTAQHDMIFANQGIVKYCRNRGIDLAAYTVNDNMFARRMQEAGVYKIISDRLTGELQR